mmetsp:Transcript_34987/g.73821  ORF Transcript_34987/g.73821 Transcript_34987/m.73821 type:complete len:310 (-) Transcript_34987:58-987(-)
MSAPPSARPYTSYNLFFQLEREYILQIIHGYKPKIESKDIFDPADATYPADGPALPTRYENLILPFDWHIPGKTRRRKRSHRKSHGKIGFHELNDQISKAWSAADDEVKNFCICLADIEAKKYKKTKKANAKRKTKKTKNALKKDGFGDLSPTLEDFPTDFADFFNVIPATGDAFQGDEMVPSTKICRTVSRESIDRVVGDLPKSSAGGSFAEVDMKDDEIIDIWKATSIEDDAIHSILSSSQFCVEITNNSPDCHTTEKEFKENAIVSKPFCYIDAEYAKFKEIGKQFATKQKLPRNLKKNAITARQA